MANLISFKRQGIGFLFGSDLVFTLFFENCYFLSGNFHLHRLNTLKFKGLYLLQINRKLITKEIVQLSIHYNHFHLHLLISCFTIMTKREVRQKEVSEREKKESYILQKSSTKIENP